MVVTGKDKGKTGLVMAVLPAVNKTAIGKAKKLIFIQVPHLDKIDFFFLELESDTGKTAGFSLYLANFGSYERVYGVLGVPEMVPSGEKFMSPAVPGGASATSCPVSNWADCTRTVRSP